MARYVLVAADGYYKEIMGGPFDVEDPSTITEPEGQRLMLEEEAFAAGYHYAEGGGAGFAPEDPQDAGRGEGHGHDHHDHDDGRGEGGGHGVRGPQGREGGQGAQAQPGGQGQQ